MTTTPAGYRLTDGGRRTMDFLARIGQATEREIATHLAVPSETAAAILGNLTLGGMVYTHDLQRPDAYQLTPRGRLRIKAGPTSFTAGSIATPRDNSFHVGTYVDESRPARRGAEDALGLPSRQFNRLHFRDGRVTPVDSQA